MRKATWHLIPLISVGYGVAYMDRVNIGFASLQMNRDLHFSATVYGLGAGLFFLSYAACEIPSNLLLYRVGARRWMSRIMFTWGILAMGMMFVRTPWQFYTMRFLLGMAEAGFFPGIIYYLMEWFPSAIRARTITRFYVALPLSSVVMGGLAGTLLNLQGKLGLAGWQWLFLIEGLPSIALSLVFLKLLPDSPAKAPWLTDSERAWIAQTIKLEGTQLHGTQDHGVSKTLKDSRVWLIGIFTSFMLASNYAFTFSAPAIVQAATGFSNNKVGFVIAGMGLLGAASMILGGWDSDRTGERYLHIILPCLVIVACYTVCGLTSNPVFMLPAFALSFASFNAVQGAVVSLPGLFLRGKSAAAGVAAINMVGMLGGFFGPYWMGWAKDFTGTYQRGLGTLAVPMLVGAGIMVLLRSRTARL